MDKREIFEKLKDMFNEEKNTEKDSKHLFERNVIEKREFLTLIVNDTTNINKFIDNPDFDKFVNLLISHKTNECIYNANRLKENKIKILEKNSSENNKIIKEINDLYNRLLTSTNKTLPLVYLLINDWINSLLKEI